MKAIRTRYSGPTNTRGARIHATDSDGNRASISYPYELTSDEAHGMAAYVLMRKMGWSNELVGGGFGHDMYWTMLPREPRVPPFSAAFFHGLDTTLKERTSR